MGLRSGPDIEQSRAGLEGAREGGAVGFERVPSHGAEGSKSNGRVAGASQIGDHRVPGGDAVSVHVFVEEGYEVGRLCRETAFVELAGGSSQSD